MTYLYVVNLIFRRNPGQSLIFRDAGSILRCNQSLAGIIVSVKLDDDITIYAQIACLNAITLSAPSIKSVPVFVSGIMKIMFLRYIIQFDAACHKKFIIVFIHVRAKNTVHDNLIFGILAISIRILMAHLHIIDAVCRSLPGQRCVSQDISTILGCQAGHSVSVIERNNRVTVCALILYLDNINLSPGSLKFHPVCISGIMEIMAIMSSARHDIICLFKYIVFFVKIRAERIHFKLI